MEAGGDELKQRAERHIERAKSLGIPPIYETTLECGKASS